MNSYHPNIKLTIEISPKKFLDTKILRISNQIQCFMYQKESKKLIHWHLAVPKSYERNAIIGDVHHAKRISCDFDYEILVIVLKCIKAGYPPKFVTSVINTCPVEKEEQQFHHKSLMREKQCISSYHFVKLMNKT